MKTTSELLATPLGTLLSRLLDAPSSPSGVSTWQDIRDPSCPAPYRVVLGAAQRGELRVHKVGRRRLVRCDELDAWIAGQPVVSEPAEPVTAPTDSAAAKILERNGWRRAG